MIVPLYKGKGERTEYKNYRGISLLTVVGKIYAGILVDKVCRVTEGLIEDEQGDFRSGRGCVDQIFILSQIVRRRKRKSNRCMWVLWTWRRCTIAWLKGRPYGRC